MRCQIDRHWHSVAWKTPVSYAFTDNWLDVEHGTNVIEACFWEGHNVRVKDERLIESDSLIWLVSEKVVPEMLTVLSFESVLSSAYSK